MKNAHHTDRTNRVEALLSEKLERTEPRPGFAGRVVAHLDDRAGGSRNLSPFGLGAIACGAVAALLVLAVIWGGNEGGRDRVADSTGENAEMNDGFPEDKHRALDGVSNLSAAAGSWVHLPLEQGLKAESEALRKDVQKVGNALARSVPRFARRTGVGDPSKGSSQG